MLHGNPPRGIVPQPLQSLPWQTAAEQMPQSLYLQPNGPLQRDAGTGGQNLGDPGSDDLFAVVFGGRRVHGPPRGGESEALPATVPGMPFQHGQVQDRRDPGPSMPSEEVHNEPSTHEEPGSAYLQDVEPLALSGLPAMILYQEDDAIDILVAQIKDLLAIDRRSRKFEPRPLRSQDPAEFTSDIKHYLRSDRLYKELHFDGRTVLVSYLNGIPKTSQSLTNKGLIVWELKTDGERAVMVCRGIYTLEPKFWPDLRSLAQSQSYTLRIDRDAYSHLDLLSVSKGAPNTLYTYEQRLNPVRHPSEPDSEMVNTRFLYEPISNLKPYFDRWLRGTLGVKYRLRFEPEFLLDPKDKDAFSARMYESFKHRHALRKFTINGEPYLWSHHPRYKDIASLPNRFSALWRHQKGAANNDVMIAVGLFPMTRNTYLTAAKNARLPVVTFTFHALRMRSRVGLAAPGSSVELLEPGHPARVDSPD